jgi:hypothetical protein
MPLDRTVTRVDSLIRPERPIVTNPRQMKTVNDLA